MDALHFAYWLRGYTEITNGAQPNAVQWQVIQDHLNEVFTKVTPNRYDPTLTTEFARLTGELQRPRFYWNDGVPQLNSILTTC